jgi:hypothetical protein
MGVLLAQKPKTTRPGGFVCFRIHGAKS